MSRRFDHIDLRVPRLEDARAFYSTLLPALGFTRAASIEGWLTFEAGGPEITEFFGITECDSHAPNQNRVAFWAESAAEVDRLVEIIRGAGAINIEGPMDYERGYYALFFEDPWGNRLEICHRFAS